MQFVTLEFNANFHLVAGNDLSQAAVMVLTAGESTGGADNRHAGSDQWLYVIEGEGEAIVAGKRHSLRPHVLLLIERGEPHRISNTGHAMLKALNVYVPPEYSEQEGRGPERD